MITPSNRATSSAVACCEDAYTPATPSSQDRGAASRCRKRIRHDSRHARTGRNRQVRERRHDALVRGFKQSTPENAPAFPAYRLSMAMPENAPAFPAYRPSMATPENAPAFPAYRPSMAMPENAPAFPAYRPSMAIKIPAIVAGIGFTVSSAQVRTLRASRALSRPLASAIHGRRGVSASADRR